ncbi:hypothetical protein HDV62DRAFT_324647 [Trichoderma sp. SZMC 28011]
MACFELESAMSMFMAMVMAWSRSLSSMASIKVTMFIFLCLPDNPHPPAYWWPLVAGSDLANSSTWYQHAAVEGHLDDRGLVHKVKDHPCKSLASSAGFIPWTLELPDAKRSSCCCCVLKLACVLIDATMCGEPLLLRRPHGSTQWSTSPYHG